MTGGRGDAVSSQPCSYRRRARALSAAAVRSPGDRRLLSAAARASWEAGDAAAALALASARLDQDADHAGALALTAEVLIATDRA